MRIESRTRDRKFARCERVLRIRRKNTVERDIGSTRISTRASSRVESLAVKLYPTPHRTRKEERKREKEEEKYSSLAAARYAYESTLCVLDSHRVTGSKEALYTYCSRTPIDNPLFSQD